MSCFGLCGDNKRMGIGCDGFVIVYNKAAETVVIETQTSDHFMPDELPLPPLPIHKPDVAIIDLGSCNLRAGFAGDEKPLITIPTVVGASLLDDVTQKVFGSTALTSSNDYELSYPVDKGFIKNFHDTGDILEFVMDHHLRIKPYMHQLMLTEPPNNSPLNREKTAEMIFEKLQMSSFLLMPSTPMGLYGYGSTTGIIVESGAGQTHIVAVKDGDYIQKSYRHIPIGGNDLTKYLAQLLTQRGNATYFHGKGNECKILEEIKAIGCFTALDHSDEEKFTLQNRDSTRDIVLSDGTIIAMNHECFQVPELLFKPELIGITTGGIPKNIVDCIRECDPDLQDKLYQNICLCGGNTRFDYIEHRILREVKMYAGPKVEVNINAIPERENLVFLGTSLVGVCPKLKDNLITHGEYQETGPQILQWKHF